MQPSTSMKGVSSLMVGAKQSGTGLESGEVAEPLRGALDRPFAVPLLELQVFEHEPEFLLYVALVDRIGLCDFDGLRAGRG